MRLKENSMDWKRGTGRGRGRKKDKGKDREGRSERMVLRRKKEKGRENRSWKK